MPENPTNGPDDLEDATDETQESTTDAADSSQTATDAADSSGTATDAADSSATAPGGADSEAESPELELPAAVIEEAERLTRLAREAVDEGAAEAYRDDRAQRLASFDFTARVREDDGGSGETLVLHPVEWVDEGVVRPARVDDVDRAVEISLSGTGQPDDWEAVDERNRELVERVRETRGDTHAAVVTALADFASNHYAKPIVDLSPAELEEFEADYVRRNAWLTEAQERVLEESVRSAFEAAKERVPDW